MTQTIVRVDATRLAAMMQRVNSMLTEEGARAWYRNDVADLAQEVILLRQELTDGFVRLLEDFEEQTTREGETLPELVERWKAQATGVYEKTQVKKARMEATNAKLEAMTLREQLAAAEQKTRDVEAMYDHSIAEWQQAEAALQHAVAEAVTVNETLRNEMAALEARLASCEQRCGTLEHEANTKIMAAAVEVDQFKREMRESLHQLVEKVS